VIPGSYYGCMALSFKLILDLGAHVDALAYTGGYATDTANNKDIRSNGSMLRHKQRAGEMCAGTCSGRGIVPHRDILVLLEKYACASAAANAGQHVHDDGQSVRDDGQHVRDDGQHVRDDGQHVLLDAYHSQC
jgi:hypothetical protein